MRNPYDGDGDAQVCMHNFLSRWRMSNKNAMRGGFQPNLSFLLFQRDMRSKKHDTAAMIMRKRREPMQWTMEKCRA